jgi:hypothetical protein
MKEIKMRYKLPKRTKIIINENLAIRMKKIKVCLDNAIKQKDYTLARNIIDTMEEITNYGVEDDC